MSPRGEKSEGEVGVDEDINESIGEVKFSKRNEAQYIGKN